MAPIVTKRLVLSALSESDKGAFFSLMQEEGISKTYMVPSFESKEKEDRFYERITSLCLDSSHFVRGIYLNNELIGFINDCGVEGKQIEIGYFIDQKQWNKGYATEAFSAAIKELFSQGYERILSGYFEGNLASRRVMEKCGMTPIEKEETIVYRGVPRLCRYFEIRKEKEQ